ncbi:hypothetical protein ABT298_17730, partial [Streptomyces sp. NPDC001034]
GFFRAKTRSVIGLSKALAEDFGGEVPRLPETPVATRTPPPISHRLKPRLATALFRRYLRACIPTGPDRATPLAGARPEGVLTETQRVGQRRP